jgi:hypothetical protein
MGQLSLLAAAVDCPSLVGINLWQDMKSFTRNNSKIQGDLPAILEPEIKFVRA